MAKTFYRLRPDLYENGLRDDAVTVFPDFTIRHRLKAVELHDPPKC